MAPAESEGWVWRIISRANQHHFFSDIVEVLLQILWIDGAIPLLEELVMCLGPGVPLGRQLGILHCQHN